MPQHRLDVFQRLASYKWNKKQVVALRHWFMLQAQIAAIWTVLPHGQASCIQLKVAVALRWRLSSPGKDVDCPQLPPRAAVRCPHNLSQNKICRIQNVMQKFRHLMLAYNDYDSVSYVRFSFTNTFSNPTQWMSDAHKIHKRCGLFNRWTKEHLLNKVHIQYKQGQGLFLIFFIDISITVKLITTEAVNVLQLFPETCPEEG